MNKNIYLVIFNAARGVWVAVQETATGFGKGRSVDTASKASVAIARVGCIDILAMRHVAFAALCVLGTQPMSVNAQLVAAPGGNGSKPIVGVAANGLPMVHIATPNAAGVSNNSYTQYNVGANGLILNNSQGNVLTQQAGYIAGNPNLASGAARVIVNQVIGGNASQLLGYTEVAGQRAEVVIANPAGIYCNGCGFINTTRAMLITGTPMFGGTGSLDAFRVIGGQIRIGAGGLNGSNIDRIDLIARSVELNGKVWAGQSLNVVAGNNDVRYSDLGAQWLGPDGNSPGVAIDVAQLGGMYAGKIRLVGTETGVGVNSAGTIASQSGDLELSSQGKVTLSGATSANGNATVSSAGDISNIGSVYAMQNTTLSSQGQVGNSGTIAALGNTAVTGAGVNSTGTLGAGIDADGNVTGPGSLEVTSEGAVAATGQQVAGGDLALSGSSLNMAGAQTLSKGNTSLTATGAGGNSGSIVHTGASLQADGSLTVNAAGRMTNDQGRASAAQLSMTAGSMSNQGGTISQTGAGVMKLVASEAFDNTGGTVTANAETTTIRSGSLINVNGQITQAGTGSLEIDTGMLDNSHGSIATDGRATIAATSLANGAGSITSAQTLNVASDGDIDNTAGRLEASGAVSVSGANVENTAGRIVSQSADGLTLTASGQITNAAGETAQGAMGGVIGGNGDATVRAASLTNSGTVNAALTLDMTASGALDNSNGTLSAASLAANAASLKNESGEISANTVSLTVPQLDNSGGQITANQLNISAVNLTNKRGTLTQRGSGAMGLEVSGTLDNANGGVIETNSTDLTLAPASLNNNDGTITHAGTGMLTINPSDGAGAITNVGGKIATNGRAKVSAGTIDNSGGTIGAQTGLAATVTGSLDNTTGRLTSNADLSVTSGTKITNIGGTIAASGNATLLAESLTNGGSMTADQTLNATVTGALDNSNGTLSGQTVMVNAASFKNASGIVSGNAVSMTTPLLDNSYGRITANQFDVSATNLTNAGGSITQLGTGAMGLGVSGAIDNTNGGVIRTNSGDLSLASASVNNNGGTIIHAGAGTLRIDAGNGSGSLKNVGGDISTNGQASVSVGSLDNTGGTLRSQDALSANVQAVLNNTNGRLSSGTALTASSGGALVNVGGIIGAGGAVTDSALILTAASIDNAAGAITNVGSGATKINGGSQITNSNAGGASGMGAISGNGDVMLNAVAISNTQGGQLSGANLRIDTDNLDNSGGVIGNVANATGDVGITTGTLTATNGQINASRNLSVAANALSGGGAYSAVNDLTVNLQGNLATALNYSFNAGHDLSLTLPGTFSNGGALSAVNDLIVSAGDIQNAGTMGAGGLLSTHSNTLTNTSTIVGGSVSLNAAQALSNLGTGALIGATDSAGTLELLAPNIENRDDTTATDTRAMTAIYGLGKVVLAGGKDASGNYTKANLVNNQSALIQSGGDMKINADRVINTRRVMTTGGFTSSIDPTLLANLGISLSGRTGQVGVKDPNSIGGVYTDPPHGGQWNSSYQYTTYSGAAVANTVTSISPESQIVSGGDLDTGSVGTFENYWSRVTAAENIASPATLNQNSWQGQPAPQVQVTYSGQYHYNNYDNSEHNWQLPFGDAGFVTSRPGGYTQAAPADVRTYALPSYESTFTAGGTIGGTGVTINNTAGNAGVTPLGLLPGQFVSNAGAGAVDGTIASGGGTRPVAVAVHGGHVANGNLSGFDNPVARATAVNVLNNIVLPKGGLFNVDAAPNAPYLVETNPAFTDSRQWLSSDYYFQQMGLDHGKIQLRLGDGFYEQKLVQDQLMSMTGRSVLTNYANTQDQFKALMTSGVELAKSLDLAPGTALSSEHVAQLTNNVVIMQTEIVDGHMVLVPVVYLAKVSQENMGNGPVIAATDIDLQNAESVINSGTIKAANSFTISGQTIDSSFGTLQSGGAMRLATAGDVNLTSATANAGSVVLLAGGNLILDTAVKTLDQVSATGATRVSSTLGPAASINAGGDAAISTAGNFQQNAGALNVGGALGMSIGGNWNLGVQQTGETKVVARANGISDTHIVSDTGSSVKVGGASAIAVGGDVTATGAKLDLGGGGTIAAKGNVTLQAAKATSTVNSNSSGSDRHGSYAETLHTSDDTLTETTLKGGDSVNIVSGKDIDVAGSTLSLDKGNALLMAAGHVNVGSATETHVDNAHETHSHSGVASRASAINEVDQTATYVIGSTISADGVSLISGKDINVTGSSIVGTHDVGLAATGNVNINAATDTWQANEYHQEKRSGLSGSGGLGVTIGSSERSGRYDGSSVTQSQSRSTVGSIEGNVAISAGQDVHIGGSDVIAGEAAGDVTGATGNIDIAGQNVTIEPGLDSAKSSNQQESRSSGVTVAMTGTPLDTVRNLKANASTGNGFRRTQSVANEIGATAGTVQSISVSYGNSRDSSTTEISSLANTGSTIRGGGDVSIAATGGAVKDANGRSIDGDLSVIGSTISAAGQTSLAANRHMTLQASTDQFQQSSQSSSSSMGISLATPTPGDLGRWIDGTANSGGTSSSPYNASRSSSNGSQSATAQTATVVSGNSVALNSETGDINVVGSGISGTQGVNLLSKQGAINVLAGLDTNASHQESGSQQVGSLGSNSTATGFSIGVANSHSVQDAAARKQSTMRSQIVSGSGNVTLDAKQDLTVAGADIGSAKDLTLIGKNLNLDPGTDATQSSMSQDSSQFGVTLALGGAAGNAVAAVNQSMARGARGGDARLGALDKAQAGLAVYDAYEVASALSADNLKNQPLVKVTVSVGGGSSHSDSQSSSLANDGSTLHAGGNANLIAAGSGAKDANGLATAGDINASGTQISGQNVMLNAARDINLQSAQDTGQQSSRNRSSGGSIGVGLNIGGQQNGFTIELAANAARGRVNGESVTNRDTQVSASDMLSMTSGRDTNLRGAQVVGDTVDASVGRDLNIQSRQDRSTYDSKQTSAGVQMSICVPPICYGQAVSGSASASQEDISATYQSVKQQSGIFAGSGGFNVNVGNHTQLDGGAIASTASAEKNTLSTQTFGYSNLENYASYSGGTVGLSASGAFGQSTPDGVSFNTPVQQTAGNAAGPLNSQGLGPTGFSMVGTSSDATGTTYAAVSPGAITVRGDAGTGQDSSAGLSRDTAHANGAVQDTFDAQKVQNDMATQQSVRQVGMRVVGEVATVLQSRARAALEKAKQAYADSDAVGDTAGMEQAQADMTAAKQQLALWGNDGAARIGSHAVVAGLGATMGGGSLAGAVGGTIVGDVAGNAASRALGDSVGGKLLSNVAAGVAGAAVGGALGGSAGAISGSGSALTADLYNRQLHPDEKKWIDENEASYAKKYGLTLEQARDELTTQANLQVQNGSPGPWNQRASEFLGHAHGMLPADGNSGPGYMFYATPEQKVDPNMYAGYYSNGAALNLPAASDIASSVNAEQANRNRLGGATIAAATGGALIVGAPIATAVGSTAYAVIGAATGGGMDAAGQYAQTGAIRPAQSLFAVATGAVTAPIGASTGFISNVLLGGAGAGVNTAFNNLFYGDSSSVLFASSVGATFNGAAYPIGLGLTKMTGQLLPPFVYPNGLNPNVPALLQGVRNPYPANIGAAAGSLTQGVGSFVPGKAPDGRSSSK